MKLTIVLALLLVAAVVVTINARNKRAREAAAAAALARQRAARRNRVPDVSKLEQYTSFRPQIPLEQTLREVIDYFLGLEDGTVVEAHHGAPEATANSAASAKAGGQGAPGANAAGGLAAR